MLYSHIYHTLEKHISDSEENVRSNKQTTAEGITQEIVPALRSDTK
jgi:hypothetical protein